MSFVNVCSVLKNFVSMQTIAPEPVGGFLTVVGSLLQSVWQAFLTLVYWVVKWFLAVVDFLQYFIQKLIGLDYWLSEAPKSFKGATESDLLFTFLYNDTVQRVFRAMIAVFFILLIIFTIFAIVKQEWTYATGGFESKEGNSKVKIMRDSIKAIALVLVFPVILLVGIISSNAILASIVNALSINMSQTFGGTIFSIGSQNANRYRAYASNDLHSATSDDVIFYVNSNGRTILYSNGTSLNEEHCEYISDYAEYIKTINLPYVKKYKVDSTFDMVIPSEHSKFSGYCALINYDGESKYFMVHVGEDDDRDGVYYYLRNILQAKILNSNTDINDQQGLSGPVFDLIFNDIKRNFDNTSSKGYISKLDLRGISQGSELAKACYNTWGYSSILNTQRSFVHSHSYGTVGNTTLQAYGISSIPNAKLFYNANTIAGYFDGGQFGVVQKQAEYLVMADVIDFINESEETLYMIDATSNTIEWEYTPYYPDSRWVTQDSDKRVREGADGITGEEVLPFIVSYSENCLNSEAGNALYLAKEGVGSELSGSVYIMCFRVAIGAQTKYIPLVNGKTFKNPDTLNEVTFKSDYLASNYRGVVVAKGIFDTDSTDPKFGRPTYIQTSITNVSDDIKDVINDAISDVNSERHYYHIEDKAIIEQYVTIENAKRKGYAVTSVNIPAYKYPNYTVQQTTSGGLSDEDSFEVRESLSDGSNVVVQIDETMIKELTINLRSGINEVDKTTASYAGYSFKENVNDNSKNCHLYRTQDGHYFVVKHDFPNKTFKLLGVDDDGSIVNKGVGVTSAGNSLNNSWYEDYSNTTDPFNKGWLEGYGASKELALIAVQRNYKLKVDWDLADGSEDAEGVEISGSYRPFDFVHVETNSGKSKYQTAEMVGVFLQKANGDTLYDSTSYMVGVFNTTESDLVTYKGNKINFAEPSDQKYVSELKRVYLLPFIVGAIGDTSSSYDLYKYDMTDGIIDENDKITNLEQVCGIEDKIDFIINSDFNWSNESTSIVLYNGKNPVAKVNKLNGAEYTTLRETTTKMMYGNHTFYNVATQNRFSIIDSTDLSSTYEVFRETYSSIYDSMVIGFYCDGVKGIVDKLIDIDMNLNLFNNFRFKTVLFNRREIQTKNVGYFSLKNGIGFDYMFSNNNSNGKVDGDVHFNTFYIPSKISYWVILISAALIIKALGAALWGVIRRFYEITLYFIAMPAVASTIALDGGNRFNKQIQTPLVAKVLATYGVILGLNVFFILLSPIKSISSSVFTVEEIMSSNNFFLKSLNNSAISSSFVVYLLNQYVYILFVLVAFTMIDALPKMLSDLISSGNVHQEGMQLKDQVLKPVEMAGSIISGKAIAKKARQAKEVVLDMLPLSAGVRWVNDKAKGLGPKGKAGGGGSAKNRESWYDEHIGNDSDAKDSNEIDYPVRSSGNDQKYEQDPQVQGVVENQKTPVGNAREDDDDMDDELIDELVEYAGKKAQEGGETPDENDEFINDEAIERQQRYEALMYTDFQNGKGLYRIGLIKRRELKAKESYYLRQKENLKEMYWNKAKAQFGEEIVDGYSEESRIIRNYINSKISYAEQEKIVDIKQKHLANQEAAWKKELKKSPKDPDPLLLSMYERAKKEYDEENQKLQGMSESTLNAENKYFELDPTKSLIRAPKVSETEDDSKKKHFGLFAKKDKETNADGAENTGEEKKGLLQRYDDYIDKNRHKSVQDLSDDMVGGIKMGITSFGSKIKAGALKVKHAVGDWIDSIPGVKQFKGAMHHVKEKFKEGYDKFKKSGVGKVVIGTGKVLKFVATLPFQLPKIPSKIREARDKAINWISNRKIVKRAVMGAKLTAATLSLPIRAGRSLINKLGDAVRIRGGHYRYTSESFINTGVRHIKKSNRTLAADARLRHAREDHERAVLSRVQSQVMVGRLAKKVRGLEKQKDRLEKRVIDGDNSEEIKAIRRQLSSHRSELDRNKRLVRHRLNLENSTKAIVKQRTSEVNASRRDDRLAYKERLRQGVVEPRMRASMRPVNQSIRARRPNTFISVQTSDLLANDNQGTVAQVINNATNGIPATESQKQDIIKQEFNIQALNDASFIDDKVIARVNTVINKSESRVGRKIAIQTLANYSQSARLVSEQATKQQRANAALQALLTAEMKRSIVKSTLKDADFERLSHLTDKEVDNWIKQNGYEVNTAISGNDRIMFNVNQGNRSIKVGESMTNDIMKDVLKSAEIKEDAIDVAITETNADHVVDKTLSKNLALGVNFDQKTTDLMANMVLNVASKDENMVSEAMLRHIESKPDLYEKFLDNFNQGNEIDLKNEYTRKSAQEFILRQKETGDGFVSSIKDSDYEKEFKNVVAERAKSGEFNVTPWDVADEGTKKYVSDKISADINSIGANTIMNGATKDEQNSILANVALNIMEKFRDAYESGKDMMSNLMARFSDAIEASRRVQNTAFVASLSDEDINKIASIVIQALTGKSDVADLNGADRAVLGFANIQTDGNLSDVTPMNAGEYIAAFNNYTQRVNAFQALPSDIQAQAIRDNELDDKYAQIATNDPIMGISAETLAQEQAAFFITHMNDGEAKSRIQQLYQGYAKRRNLEDSDISTADVGKLKDFFMYSPKASNIITETMKSEGVDFAALANQNYSNPQVRTDDEKKTEYTLSKQLVGNEQMYHVLTNSKDIANRNELVNAMLSEYSGVDFNDENSVGFRNIVNSLSVIGIKPQNLMYGYSMKDYVIAYVKESMINKNRVQRKEIDGDIGMIFAKDDLLDKLNTQVLQAMEKDKDNNHFSSGKSFNEALSSFMLLNITGNQKDMLRDRAIENGFLALSEEQQNELLIDTAYKTKSVFDKIYRADQRVQPTVLGARRATYADLDKAVKNIENSITVKQSIIDGYGQGKDFVDNNTGLFEKSGLLSNGTVLATDSKGIEKYLKSNPLTDSEVDQINTTYEKMVQLMPQSERQSFNTDSVYDKLRVIANMKNLYVMQKTELSKQIAADTELLEKLKGKDGIAELNEMNVQEALAGLDFKLKRSDISHFLSLQTHKQDRDVLVEKLNGKSLYEISNMASGKNDVEIYNSIRQEVDRNKVVENILQTQGELIDDESLKNHIQSTYQHGAIQFMADEFAARFDLLSKVDKEAITKKYPNIEDAYPQIERENKIMIALGLGDRINQYASAIKGNADLIAKARKQFAETYSKDFNTLDELTQNQYLTSDVFRETLSISDRDIVNGYIKKIDAEYVRSFTESDFDADEIIEEASTSKMSIDSVLKNRLFSEQAKILEKVEDKLLNAKVFEKISQENFDRLHAAARQANNGKELDLLIDAKRTLIKGSNLESLTETFNPKSADVSVQDKRAFERRQGMIERSIRTDPNSDVLANAFKNARLLNEKKVTESIINSLTDEKKKKLLKESLASAASNDRIDDVKHKLTAEEINKYLSMNEGIKSQLLNVVATNPLYGLDKANQDKRKIEAVLANRALHSDVANNLVGNKLAEIVMNSVRNKNSRNYDERLANLLNSNNVEEVSRAEDEIKGKFNALKDIAVEDYMFKTDSNGRRRLNTENISENAFINAIQKAENKKLFKDALARETVKLFDPQRPASNDDLRAFFANNAMSAEEIARIQAARRQPNIHIKEAFDSFNQNGIVNPNGNSSNAVLFMAKRDLPENSAAYENWNKKIDERIKELGSKVSNKEEIEKLKAQKVDMKEPKNYESMSDAEKKVYERTQRANKTMALDSGDYSSVYKLELRAVKPSMKLVKDAVKLIGDGSGSFTLLSAEKRQTEEIKEQHIKKLTEAEMRVTRYEESRHVRKDSYEFGENFNSFVKTYFNSAIADKIANKALNKFLERNEGNVDRNGVKIDKNFLYENLTTKQKNEFVRIRKEIFETQLNKGVNVSELKIKADINGTSGHERPDDASIKRYVPAAITQETPQSVVNTKVHEPIETDRKQNYNVPSAHPSKDEILRIIRDYEKLKESIEGLNSRMATAADLKNLGQKVNELYELYNKKNSVGVTSPTQNV